MIEVIVTGAGKGIGLSLCREMVRRGNKVLGISRNVEALREVDGVGVIASDLTLGESILPQVEAFFGSGGARLRILIHNAGLLVNKPFTALSADEIQAMTAINFLVPMRLTTDLMGWMLGAEAGHCLYIGSMGGFQGSSRYPGLSVYSATKSAGASLMESLAAEYAGKGLYFNTLALGAVDTEMLKSAFPGYSGGMAVEGVSEFICGFAEEGFRVMNGRTLPVSLSNP